MEAWRWLLPTTRTIDILGEEWTLKVEKAPDNVKELAQFGECSYARKYIYIWLTGEAQRDLDTLFHELIHAIRMQTGLESTTDNEDKEQDRKDHSQINPMALGLAYFFTKNEVL